MHYIFPQLMEMLSCFLLTVVKGRFVSTFKVKGRGVNRIGSFIFVFMIILSCPMSLILSSDFIRDRFLFVSK